MAELHTRTVFSMQTTKDLSSFLPLQNLLKNEKSSYGGYVKVKHEALL
jgi:hypothetical protein